MKETAGEGRKMSGVNNMWHISKISARAAHGFYISARDTRRGEAALPAPLEVATGGNLTFPNADRVRRGRRQFSRISER